MSEGPLPAERSDGHEAFCLRQELCTNARSTAQDRADPHARVSAEPIESKSLTGESHTQPRCRCRRQVLLLRSRLATSRMRASPPFRIRHLAYDSIPRQFIFSSKAYIKQSTDHLFYGPCRSTVAPASHDPPKTFFGEARISSRHR